MKPEYNELDKAQEAINQAAQHPKTQAKAKTWYYRGLVYHKIFHTKDERFKDLDPNPLKEAYQSYTKAYGMDEKERYTKEIIFKLTVAGTEFFNKGSAEYLEKKFAESLESFETVLEIGALPYINQVDSGAYFNAAIAADQAQIYDKALEYYKKSIEFKYGVTDDDRSNVYHYVASVYAAMGDSVLSVQTYMDGIAAYPENSVLLYIQLINYYLGNGNLEKASEFIVPAVEKDPENFSLWNVYGEAFKESDEERAIEGYSMAIELNEDYFDPYFGIGIIYFNRGVEANNSATDIPLSETEKYDTAIAQRDAYFKQAQPYFEKAYEIDSTFPGVLTALKEIYYRFKENDKLEEIKKRIEELK